MQNFFNSIKFIQRELKEEDLKNFQENINEIIMQLAIKDFQDNKKKEE